MKKLAVLSLSTILFAGCGQTGQTTANVNTGASNANLTAATTAPRPNNSLVVSSHSTDKTAASDAAAPKSESRSKWTQSGNPIDTTALDAAVRQADAKVKADPKDEAAKKALAEAYVKRGIELTNARQYASALGDYRKALKLDPANEEAKTWIEQIIGIYESIDRDYPKEGEEPPPLPFKKES